LFGLSLGGTHVLGLLIAGLESSVSKFGGSIDELQLDLFQSSTACLNVQGLSEGNRSLLGARNLTLDHAVVVLHNTIIKETTHKYDGLFGEIELSGGVLLVVTLSNSVNLLVGLGSVVETELTSTSNGEGNSARMPCSNTSDLSETLVCLSGQLLGSPSLGDTLETLTLGGGKAIDHLRLLEDRVNRDLLLEKGDGEVDLLFNGSTVNLDFQNVSCLGSQRSLADLSVGKDSHNCRVLLDLGNLGVDLSLGLDVLLGVLGEGLLLGSVPSLVEATSDILAQVSSEDGGQGSETLRGLDVTNNTNNDDGGCLNDGDGFNDFLLVDLGTGLVSFTDNVGHASLVTNESSQVRSSSGIILREGSDATLVVLGSLLWKVLQ